MIARCKLLLQRPPACPAPPHSASLLRTPIRRCGDALGFVPWLALAALALLVAGLVVFAMQAKDAVAAADALLGAVAADAGAGFPSAMAAWDSSIWATVGVGGATCAFLALLAAVRLDQKLRRAGKYGRARGALRCCLALLLLACAAGAPV